MLTQLPAYIKNPQNHLLNAPDEPVEITGQQSQLVLPPAVDAPSQITFTLRNVLHSFTERLHGADNQHPQHPQQPYKAKDHKHRPDVHRGSYPTGYVLRLLTGLRRPAVRPGLHGFDTLAELVN